MFENKTNSQILTKLEIPENILKFKYMTTEGMGLDLLYALHTYISPEELIVNRKAFGITKSQVDKMMMWLESNCHMASYMKLTGLGYNFSKRSIFDNASWGLLTKIRRHVTEWEPKVDQNGDIQYCNFDWLSEPKILYKGEEAIVIRRDKTYKWRNDSGYMDADMYYTNNPICYRKVNGKWKLVSKDSPYMQDIFNAIEMADRLLSA